MAYDTAMRKTSLILAALLLLTPTFSSALTITRGLAVGSRGADVTALQEFLISQNFLKVSATGYFGLMTKVAVMDFQKTNGLEAVGSVGPKTRALLATMSSNAGTGAPEPVSPTSTQAPPPTTPIPSPGTTTSSSGPTPAPESTTLVITAITPSILPRDTAIADLSVSTNRNANCRYATTANMAFSSMTAFSITGGKLHTKTFTGLGNGNLYVYYVKCEDAATLNVTNDTTVSFSISNTVSSAPVSVASAAAVDTNALAHLKALLEQASASLNSIH